MSGECPPRMSPQGSVDRVQDQCTDASNHNRQGRRGNGYGQQHNKDGRPDVNTGNEASGRHEFKKPERANHGPRPNAGGQYYSSSQYRQPHPSVNMEWEQGALPSSQSGINSYSGNGRGRETRDRSHSGDRKRQQSWSSQNYGRKQEHDDVTFLSRTLSSILRHNAGKFRLKLMPGGFIYVEEILYKVEKLYGYTIDDVKYVVESNDKQRFTLAADDGGLKIRANQGHTMEVEDLDLKPITGADDYPTVIHGTYMEAWEKIKKTGLNRMKRNHIHFAPGTPGANGVISGMRSSCEVMIYLDLEKALKDGLKFFVSSNNVILSPGDANGVIHPRYFKGAVDRYYRSRIPFDPEIVTNPGKQNKDKGQSNTGKRKQEKKDKRWREFNELGEVQSADAGEQAPSTSQGQVQGTRVDKGISDSFVCGSDEVDERKQPVEEGGSKRRKQEEKTPFKNERRDSEALKRKELDCSEGSGNFPRKLSRKK